MHKDMHDKERKRLVKGSLFFVGALAVYAFMQRPVIVAKPMAPAIQFNPKVMLGIKLYGLMWPTI